MKKYTHAWIAFSAIRRLQSIPESHPDSKPARAIVNWFKSHKDGVVSGAWYPDSIIKDNATSHVLKVTPVPSGQGSLPALPKQMLLFKLRSKSPCLSMGYQVDPPTNLPERCEALAHSVIDNLRVLAAEDRGSSVAPTSSHVSLVLFMLSHYVADAHVPLHCDSRKFSEGEGVHSEMEGVWEDAVSKCFDIDAANQRFVYERDGYPACKNPAAFDGSVLKKVQDELAARAFVVGYGDGNRNVLDYLHAVCLHSYLLSYSFVPPAYNETNVTKATWQNLAGQTVTAEEMNVASLADAVDSVSRVWLRVWRRYMS
jgi:hypothetical protein